MRPLGYSDGQLKERAFLCRLLHGHVALFHGG
jgi:hypothetical protein